MLSFLAALWWTTPQAQTPKGHLLLGPELDVPAPAHFSGTGWGGDVEGIFRSRGRWQGTLSAGFHRFSGELTNAFTGQVTHGFDIGVVMGGARWRAFRAFYVEGSAGMAIGLRHAASHLALAPGAGLQIPLGRTRFMDLGLRFEVVPSGYSFPENSVTLKGGYSYLGLRLAFSAW